MNTIYTFGYQGSSVEQLLAYQQEHNALVVDIRYAPRSRRPEWNKYALQDMLDRRNYHWLQALGNVNYANGDGIKLKDRDSALRFLRPILNLQNILLLCGCWNVETCHRKVAAEYLSEQLGAPVEHLPARAERSPAENLLKCLSLTQPWGSLVMLGKKRIETRSWQTSYRGLLGIHASKGFPKDAQALCHEAPFKRALVDAGFTRLSELPLGALLGTVQLVDIVPTEQIRVSLSPDEYAFGDYSDGRFAWILEDPQPLPAPIPMRGALQLWMTDIQCLREGVTA